MCLPGVFMVTGTTTTSGGDLFQHIQIIHMKFIKEKEMYTMAKRKPEAITSKSITRIKLTGTLRLLRYVKVIFSSRQRRKNVVQVADM